MKSIENLQDLFANGLRYVYDCEQKLVKKGLPTMIKASSSPQLRSALEQHLEETRNHVTRLEQVFTIVGEDPDTEDNDILDTMAKVGDKMASSIDDPQLRDAALIVNGNMVEHYEIAAYGSLLSFAHQLGLNQAVTFLQQTLQEEKAADEKLTQLAESAINANARPRAA